MKTSYSKLIMTEKFLRGELSPQDAVLFEAQLLLDDELKKHTFFHRMVHRLILLYGRKKNKAHLESVHAHLLNDPANSVYRESILKIFNP